jgi:hypothetical protein
MIRLMKGLLSLLLALMVLCPCSQAAAARVVERFREGVEPILAEHCLTCHASGIKKGGVALDGSPEALVGDRALWWRALKNVRAGLMPPPKRDRLSAEELGRLEDWIKYGALGIDPKDPDPGRVTLRRLNRVEYRNTVRDLMGVDYDTTAELPPDDTGHGFDNIGEVLTLSPLLLEKYLAAARTIVARAVPTTPLTIPEKTIPGQRFRRAGARKGGDGKGPLALSYYEPASVGAGFRAEHAGHYRLVIDLSATERFVDGIFDKNRCRLVFKVDGREHLRKDYGRQDGRSFHYEIDCNWQAGPHELTFDLEPLTPKESRVRSLTLRINSVTVRGPDDRQYWVRTPNYERFFPGGVPEDPARRDHYLRELLRKFATKAFRRPVDEATVERLAALAGQGDDGKGESFEVGVARAMVAVLASPRFLFREEGIEEGSAGHPLVDEYALASRLSYFLWSSMPDEELFHLAGEHRLCENLRPQVRRMLADPRSGELVRHFVGQWLQARDVETVLINAFAVVIRDEKLDPDRERMRKRFRQLTGKPTQQLSDKELKELRELRAKFFASLRRFRGLELTGEMRRAMRRESEMLFECVVREDRSLLDLLDGDYTFLNERLAKHYGIEGVRGDEMRRVSLPPGSWRGGVLTQGTVLTVTSNPDRTSPVKRGLFILDNILGMPPPPPPPDIPPLEDAIKKLAGRTPTTRESLAAHRDQALCASCHARMDPLGLSLENFNALGRWRAAERGGPIDATGRLITGEPFTDVRDLKRTLVEKHRRDFYRCLTEKMLTYALGRGLDYYDVHAVDEIVGRLEKTEGRPSALLLGIIESAPFQRRRRSPPRATVSTRADHPVGSQPTKQRVHP